MSLKTDLDRFFPRKEQQDCIDFIDSTYKKDNSVKFFLLNLPVGIGKSHLSLMIADWYSKNISSASKIDIITNSKILQDQYNNTYSSINDLKGKENYYCSDYACSCAQGVEFNRLNKTPQCKSCPYNAARDGFISGKVSLTNFYLYTLYALYMPKVLELRGANVLIIDECHEYDDVMSNFISIRMTDNVIKKMKFVNESDIIKKLKSVKTISNYIEFLNYLDEEIDTTTSQLELMIGSGNKKSVRRNNKLAKILGSDNSDTKIMQIITDLKQYKSKIEVFLKEYEIDPNNWILEKTYNEKSKQYELSMEPIWAFDYLDKYVFSKYDMVFLMSGTILDKNLFCQLNGLDIDKSVYYSIESPFPLENRPIYYMPLGKMSYKNKEMTFKNYVPYIEKILKKYPDKKGIIHTNSFELATWISRDVSNPRLVFHDSSNKDEILQEHYDSDKPSVIVSPSMDTGVSFDNDKARFQIIAKVPYPSLASQKNKLRQKMNPDWYSWRTVSGIIQMSGRVIRNGNDHADTIIIDESFGDILRYSGHFFPNWILKSIKRIEVKKTSI